MKINNTHISTLQAHLLDGSLASLLSYPALKTTAKNDWAEHHGTEYDLQNLYLKSKEITLKITLPISQWEDFKNLILTNLYADYYFSMIDRTYRLRFVGFGKTEHFAGSIITEIKLSDDEPMKGYVYENPEFNAYDTGATLNGKKLSDYGVLLLQGSKEEIIKKSNIKNTLIIENPPKHGVFTYTRPLVFQERTATLKCFIHQDKVDFFKGYEAFLYDLTKFNGSVLSYQNKAYPCIYKESKITDFSMQENKIWCEFDLNLIFI
ncbi:hypothetical protein ACILPE_06080 [Capnocytophaga canimorsus]|uniref:hypothetical protein n=1 Tax=Capnocytophaga canimorsus TaxID=28188 RepID=UPI0037D30847